MMTIPELLNYRLVNQHIVESVFKKPEELVGYFGAIQAQEYAVTKWSIGLRLKHLNDEAVEKSFNEGKILRTHVLRPTWHFVLPKDIEWILELSAPRIHPLNNYQIKKLGIETKTILKCCDIISKSLKGKNFLTR